MQSETEKQNNGELDTQERLIIGINAVSEALRSSRPVDSVLCALQKPSGAAAVLLAQCKQQGIVIKQVDARKLDKLCNAAAHQGIAAWAAAHEYASLENLFEHAAQKGEVPFFVVCDALEDPHNLGAIIRTADAVGAHGVIIPKRRSVSLNYTVAKTSAGALEYVPVARVTNLAATLQELKKRGLWVYAADMDGSTYHQQNYSGPIALVIGAEGKGLSPLVRDNCDVLVSLPMRGEINSLNASVAAGVLLFEIAKQRSECKYPLV